MNFHKLIKKTRPESDSKGEKVIQRVFTKNKTLLVAHFDHGFSQIGQ